MSNLKRQRTDDSDTNATTNVFSQQRRGFSQHPVLAPAPGPPAAVVGLGPTAFEQLQVEASIANSMQQYAAAHASGQAFGVAPPTPLVHSSQGLGHHLPAQTHQHSQSQSQQQTQQQQQFQRLKVEDALSYLDQVKAQFGKQPQVYNDFLDIMKEFKSQSIDTPGVIGRVSSLFKGHPDLIMGFNTFLPPGYKIEVVATDSQHTVTVHGPGVQSATVSQTQVQPPQSSAPVIPPNSFAALSMMVSPPPAAQAVAAVAAAAAAAASQPQSQSVQQQPVEFNHAINYVNKIKNRFQSEPDTYKAFLEILHTYQKEQRNIRELLSEAEVYQQVAKLFHHENDLLQEFGQFLPEASPSSGHHTQSSKSLGLQTSYLGQSSAVHKKTGTVTSSRGTKTGQSKRASNTGSSQGPPKKKPKSGTGKDVSIAEAGKHGSFTEYAFFDKVRKALRSHEVYENFLRCLNLFNQEIISRAELVQLITPFLGKFPDLFTWFKQFLGYKESGHVDLSMPAVKERGSELAAEIDFTSCKRCGASYRALPKSYSQPKCSGRTAWMDEVLNDTWVSFPSWSEDSTFITSRKTQYEEYIYRCEDERFELDVVLETNLSTIRYLEAVHRKLSCMSPDEQAKFRLDNCLGGTSEVNQRKAIQRIYGDKASDIIEGLKKNPSVAVPIVLRRLKAKEEEWREAQRQFNKIWREQLEKFYLKSLDHQGINFKQTDSKAMRSKSLINEIETMYDERQEQIADGASEMTGPHAVYTYQNRAVLENAADLIVHHLKRQAGIQAEDKTKIKELVYRFLPDFFFAERGDLSDDEDTSTGDIIYTNFYHSIIMLLFSFNVSAMETDSRVAGRSASEGKTAVASEDYTLLFGNNNWYILLRLHQMLCDRLFKIYRQAVVVAESEAPYKQQRKDSIAVALRLKVLNEIDVEEYYPTFLDMVKSLLDGNLDSNLFEDTCREMFGVHAYISFTMDKLIQGIVRQLQNLVTDETCIQVRELYVEESTNLVQAVNRPAAEAAYQKRAEQLLSDENCYKLVVHKKDCRLEIELIDTEDDDQSLQNPVEIEKWASYVETFVSSSSLAEDSRLAAQVKERLTNRPIFLMRNVHGTKARLRGIYRGKSEGAEDENGGSPREEGVASNASNRNPLTGLVTLGEVECKFATNSYKMKFVANTRSLMFRPTTRYEAKKLFPAIKQRKADQFDTWYDQWLEQNTTDFQQKGCSDWLSGHVTGLRPGCVTHCKTVNNVPQYVTEWATESRVDSKPKNVVEDIEGKMAES
ncbi:paired amphipathic helix protein Sin3a-like isoform X2 [Corticium candelabrum]|uniref:paired amphipathic helix protein Sin3a-like isoform X2 n=1 Tax=Corticium candelabrum TaxID=121492 RepID=UPI002E2525BB|nr:paired amphipathic helix protein Sin3a-like isoform X2 [Corticium candelabrum]